MINDELRLALFFLVLWLPFGLSAQNIFDEVNSKNYAYYLYKTGQYNLAAQEYERLHFIQACNGYYVRQLMDSYRLANKPQSAMKRFAGLSDSLKSVAGIRMEYYNALADLQLYEPIFEDLKQSNLLFAQKKEMQLAALMLAHKYERARLFYGQNGVKEASFANLQKGYLALKFKKPFVAAGLSAVVPGSGKIYAGEWKDGLVSLLFVGGNAYQAYRGLKKGGLKSVYAWIFGSIGLFFYLGNVYGSAKAARHHNQHIKSKYYQKVYSVYRSYFR